MEILDKEMNELLQVFTGYALIKKTQHDPVLNKVTREKVIMELEKTDLFQQVIVRPSKEN